MFDDQCSPIWVDGGGDVLTCQSLANEVGLAVDLNEAMIVDFADKRYAPARKRQLQPRPSIPVGIQGESFRQASQLVLVQFKPLAGQAGSVALKLQRSMRFIEVVVAKEGSIGASEGSQIATRVLV